MDSRVISMNETLGQQNQRSAIGERFGNTHSETWAKHEFRLNTK